MYIKSYDKPHTRNPLKKEMCDGGWFFVYRERLCVPQGFCNSGHTGELWRVRYTNNNITSAKHFTDADRAKDSFDEAVMFNGFLCED